MDLADTESNRDGQVREGEATSAVTASAMGLERQPVRRPSSPLLPPHGGYRRLKSFQVAELVYDVTVRFCDRYIGRRSRTHDRMTQAARSGVQNIAEGSQVSATSRKMELKLTSVARASLEELRRDYEDFLRQRNLPQWSRNDPRRADLIARRPTSADTVARWAMDAKNGQSGHPEASTASTESTSSTSASYPEIVANGALALVVVACSLLDRQIVSLAARFEQNGGFSERLYRSRRQAIGRPGAESAAARNRN